MISLMPVAKSQVVISQKSDPPVVPNASAVLQIVDDKRGLLLPSVALLNSTDAATVPTPISGVMVYNSNTAKLNFWENSKWNRNFEVADGLAIIKTTENFSGSSSNSTNVTSFPSAMPLFNMNDTTANWVDLGTSATVTISKAVNTTQITTEGMVQINSDVSTFQEFQFAIGVFVDGELKIARKYTEKGKNYVCIWKKFNLSGIFDNLSVGTHTVKIYGRNLPMITSGYSAITYGGNTSNCTNINNDMARIFVTAQVTQ